MPKVYDHDTPAVNPEIQRRAVLAALDLVTTEELIRALGCSKATLRTLRENGLEQIGPGQQKFYRASSVAAAMERCARANPEGMEADGE